MTVEEKIPSYCTKKKFEFTDWVDRSPPASTIDFLNLILVSRLNIDKIVDMSPTARKRYLDEKAEFVNKNKNKKGSTEYEYTFVTDVPDLIERTMVYQSKLGE